MTHTRRLRRLKEMCVTIEASNWRSKKMLTTYWISVITLDNSRPGAKGTSKIIPGEKYWKNDAGADAG